MRVSVVLIIMLSASAWSQEQGGPGSPQCGEAQNACFAAIAGGEPFKNHGKKVSACARASESPNITEECHSCIVSQVARRDEEVTNCGPESPDPECEPATCDTFIPCENPGECNSPVCGSIVAGGGACVEGAARCASLTPCPNGNSDCTDGLCFKDSCCGQPVCQPFSNFCNQGGSGLAATSTEGAADGPTFGSR